jgi:hypothetical protein
MIIPGITVTFVLLLRSLVFHHFHSDCYIICVMLILVLIRIITIRISRSQKSDINRNTPIAAATTTTTTTTTTTGQKQQQRQSSNDDDNTVLLLLQLLLLVSFCSHFTTPTATSIPPPLDESNR